MRPTRKITAGNEETRRIALEQMIPEIRALAEDFANGCGVALQLVPDDQNLPEDLLAIWEAIEQQGLAAV